jgi:hypothetical protein
VLTCLVEEAVALVVTTVHVVVNWKALMRLLGRARGREGASRLRSR